MSLKLQPFSCEVNTPKEKKLQKNAKGYAFFLSSIISKRQYQCFNIYSLTENIIYTMACHERGNWIVSLPGCSKQRSRDHSKKIFAAKYAIRRHTYASNFYTKINKNLKEGEIERKPGYTKQAWFVGHLMGFDQSLRDSKITGAKAYYAPKAVVKVSVLISRAVCVNLGKYYKNNINFSTALGNIRKAIYAVIKKYYTPKDHEVNERLVQSIYNSVFEHIKIGRTNSIQGGCFGISSGRRPSKTTQRSLRPHNFSTALQSRQGRKIITDSLYKLKRELKPSLKINGKLKNYIHKKIRYYFWSENYIRDILSEKKPYGLSAFDVIKLCADKALEFVSEFEDKVMNIDVHNYVHNVSRSKIKTGHYSYGMNNIIKKNNAFVGKCVEQPATTNFFNLKPEGECPKRVAKPRTKQMSQGSRTGVMTNFSDIIANQMRCFGVEKNLGGAPASGSVARGGAGEVARAALGSCPLPETNITETSPAPLNKEPKKKGLGSFLEKLKKFSDGLD